ncbi:MAG: type II secretion system protein GspD [Planctomycetota bacterium]|jgi:type II secretory pathway component GspD/PulD (secretin)
MYCEEKSSCKIKNRGNLFVWGFVLVVIAAIAVGSAGQGRVEAGVIEGTEAVGVDVSRGGGVSAGGKVQSFAFDKEKVKTIKDALRVLSALYQKNIAPSPNVNGVLGFTRLYDVTFEEAMDAILGANFKYEQTGNVIKVYTKDEYKKIKEDESRMIHRVFTLYYITAAEAEKLIKSVLSGAGQVQASSAAEGGISIGKEGVSGSKVGGDNMAWHDTIIVYDYPENIAKVEEVIKALDVKPKQVLIEATILSATLTEGMELGIDLNFLAGVSLTGTEATPDLVPDGGAAPDRGTVATTPMGQIGAGIATGSPIETAGFAHVGGSGLRIGVTMGDFTALITALESVTDITVLANPKILALNKQSGTVFIGQELGYRDRTTIDASGQATVGEVSFYQTGTKLSFRPYIGNDGYIRMDIYPQDSSGELDSEGIPRKTTAELMTNIMVKDGQTIVIGGLFRDAITSTRSQIPLLGDLPLVGVAFRGTTDSTVRQEIIVMLTPHIITEPEDTDADARAADISRKRYGARMGLQWAGRARLAEDRYTEAVKHYLDGDSQAALDRVNSVLELRPTYLEAMRLKERIISEVAPDDVATIERIMMGVIEREEANKWLRR